MKSQKEKILLYVGRIENRQKRIDLLLKTWALVQKQCIDWSLVIVGDGNSKEELTNLSLSVKLERVRWVDRCDPRPFYEKASIFALTSSFEGFGIVLWKLCNIELSHLLLIRICLLQILLIIKKMEY